MNAHPTACRGAAKWVGKTPGTVIGGKVVEKGADFVRVRQSSGYREHSDTIIPLGSICYITEAYSAE